MPRHPYDPSSPRRMHATHPAAHVAMWGFPPPHRRCVRACMKPRCPVGQVGFPPASKVRQGVHETSVPCGAGGVSPRTEGASGHARNPGALWGQPGFRCVGWVDGVSKYADRRWEPDGTAIRVSSDAPHPERKCRRARTALSPKRLLISWFPPRRTGPQGRAPLLIRVSVVMHPKHRRKVPKLSRPLVGEPPVLRANAQREEPLRGTGVRARRQAFRNRRTSAFSPSPIPSPR